MILTEQKPTIGVGLLLLAVAVVVRVYGIWEWDIVDDEYFTVTKAHERFKSVFNPAYYFLVVLTYHLFGEVDWVARLPAVIMGVVSIPASYIVWSRALGRNVALFAAVILLFSAWHLWFSQYARHYMGVFLFSSLAYGFFYRALFSKTVVPLFLGLAASLVAILFHVTAVMVPASVAVAYCCMFLLPEFRALQGRRNVIIFLASSAVVGLAATPILFHVLSYWVNTGQGWGYGPALVLPQLVRYMQLPICVVALFGWLVLVGKRHESALYFLVCVLIPVLFLMAGSAFMAVSPNYVLSIFPLVVVLAGVACEEVRSLFASVGKRAASRLVICLLIAVLLPEFVSHYLARMSLDFRDTVAFVDENYGPGDRVLSFIPGMDRVSRQSIVVVPYISFERDTSVEWAEKLSPLIESKDRTWIVVTSKRRPLAPKLENWLHCNARLVWEDHAVRLDYEIDGYQVYLVMPGLAGPSPLSICPDSSA